MRSEGGQATVEWIGLVLLIAVALAALTRLAPSADGRELATSVARSVTGAAAARHSQIGSAAAPRSPTGPGQRSPVRIGPLSVTTGSVVAPRRRPPALPAVLRRAGRGAGAAWRGAWFACLVYKRIRYGMRHPDSRLPGYTFPLPVALRMANGCLSPIDLLQGLTLLGGGG